MSHPNDITFYIIIASLTVFSCCCFKPSSAALADSGGDAQLAALHEGTVTKINYRIEPLSVAAAAAAAATGNSDTSASSKKPHHHVTLTVNEGFRPRTYIAIGFNDVRAMPGAFIVTCEKQANGTIVVRQRYAVEHAQPPVTPWGVVVGNNVVNSGNVCEFDIPQRLKAPKTVDPDGTRKVLDLSATKTAAAAAANKASGAGGGQVIFVLNSRGKVNDDDGDIQYHGVHKETSKLRFVGQ